MSRITYDRESKALYVKVGDIERGEDGSCLELVWGEVIIDRNKDGVITGIEVLNIENLEDLEE